MNGFAGGSPLAGIVVLDLSRALAGPQATMMLGDMGARVIKVESSTGDESRHWVPFIGEGEGRESSYFFSCNRNKESIVLDLKSDEGAAVLTRLARRADVLVENFRPGVMDRLGFGTKRLLELNPRLVVLSITGFGHDGPEGRRAGYDQILQGEAGLMSLTGPTPDQPTKVGVPIGDLMCGMNGAFGVVTALYQREQTGRGRVVRTSLLAAISGAHTFQATRWTLAGQIPQPAGSHHPSISPYGLFHTSTSPIQVACASERLWQSFAPIVGVDPAAARWATNEDRVRLRDELTAVIDAVLGTEPAEHWLGLLDEAGVPAGLVRNMQQVYDWPQFRSQGLAVEVDHATQGRVTIPGPVIRFDDNTIAGGRDSVAPPPTLGQHNASVLEWLDEADGSQAE